MNQHIVYLFSIVKNDKVYQVMAQPPMTYEEIQEVLSEFKNKFEELLKQQKEKEAENKETVNEVKAEATA